MTVEERLKDPRYFWQLRDAFNSAQETQPQSSQNPSLANLPVKTL